MESLIIENQGEQIVLKLSKKVFSESYLLSLVKRLEIENLAQKSDFNSSIMGIAEEINQDWWDKQGESFLKGIKK